MIGETTRRTVLGGIASSIPVASSHAWLAQIGGAVTQAIASVSPSAGSFASGAGTNTVISAVGVTMSPSSPAFTGTLSLTGTDAANFNLSSATLPSNLRTTGSLADGTYNLNIVATQGGATGSPFTQPVIVVGGAVSIATVSVNNFGGSTMAADTPVRFAHIFTDTALAAGTILAITDGAGNTVPYTAARRSRGLSGQVISLDILCKTKRSIAASATETLTLTSTAGSFSDTLPAGKTIANIVTDITTNFSTIKVKLAGLNYSGATEGSGNWQADSTTGFGTGTTPAATGYYRCVATGPAAADFVIYAPVADLVGGAQHASIWAAIYITAFLNTTTGAVQSLCWQVWLSQGKHNATSKSYRCQLSLLLNSTVVRGWGGNSGDGRTGNFTSSDVNTGTDAITLAGHSFVAGQLVRFTTTGTLPGGLSAGTDYWVGPTAAGASTFYVYAAFDDANQGSGQRGASWTVPSPTVNLTSGGSGTHTIQGYTQFGYWSTNCLADVDGGWDWHNDNSGALGGKPTLFPIQSNAYYHSTKKVPPVDLGINLALTTDALPGQLSPSCLGGISDNPNVGGAHQEYGAAINEFSYRRLRYPADRTGYVQDHRVGSIAQGQWSVHIYDGANFRIPALNSTPKGPYTGLNQIPSVDIYSVYNVPPAPVGSIGVIPTKASSHWWTFTYINYLFEGGQPMLDLILAHTNYMGAVAYRDAGFASSSRNKVTTAGTFWTPICLSGGEPRAYAWMLNQIVDGWVIAPSEGPEASYPEKAYIKDVIDDSSGFIQFCRSSDGFGANFAALGGWHTETTGNGPPNCSNISNAGLPYFADTVTTTAFEQFYIASAWLWAYMRCPTSGMLDVATHECNYVNNWWAAACNIYSNAYNHKVKDAPGWAAGATTNVNFSAVGDIGIQPQCTDGCFFSEDGATIFMLNDANNGADFQIPLQNGDRVYFWDGYDVVGNQAFDLTPTGVSAYTWFYAHNVSSLPAGAFTLTSFTLSTTNPSDTPVTWAASASSNSTTLNGAITSGAISIPLNGAVSTGSVNTFLQLAKIGSELISITPGAAQTTLTARTGSGFPGGGSVPARGAYATTAASHANGATVIVYKQVANLLIEVQTRVTGCPADTTIFGNSGGSQGFSYTAGWMQACGFAAMSGVTSSAAYNNIAAIVVNNPPSFAASSTGMLSVDPSLVF